MKAAGISIYRVTLPAIALGLLVSSLMFGLSEYVLPPTNKVAGRDHNVIKGRPPQASTTNQHRWILGSDGRFYNYDFLEQRPGGGAALYGLSIYDVTAAEWQLRDVLYVARAAWNGVSYDLERGYRRTFVPAAEFRYDPARAQPRDRAAQLLRAGGARGGHPALRRAAAAHRVPRAARSRRDPAARPAPPQARLPRRVRGDDAARHPVRVRGGPPRRAVGHRRERRDRDRLLGLPEHVRHVRQQRPPAAAARGLGAQPAVRRQRPLPHVHARDLTPPVPPAERPTDGRGRLAAAGLWCAAFLLPLLRLPADARLRVRVRRPAAHRAQRRPAGAGGGRLVLHARHRRPAPGHGRRQQQLLSPPADGRAARGQGRLRERPARLASPGRVAARAGGAPRHGLPRPQRLRPRPGAPRLAGLLHCIPSTWTRLPGCPASRTSGSGSPPCWRRSRWLGCRRGPPGLWLPLLAVAYAAALLSKEAAVGLLLFAAGDAWRARRAREEHAPRAAVALALLAVLTAAYLVVRFLVLGALRAAAALVARAAPGARVHPPRRAHVPTDGAGARGPGPPEPGAAGRDLAGREGRGRGRGPRSRAGRRGLAGPTAAGDDRPARLVRGLARAGPQPVDAEPRVAGHGPLSLPARARAAVAGARAAAGTRAGRRPGGAHPRVLGPDARADAGLPRRARLLGADGRGRPGELDGARRAGPPAARGGPPRGGAGRRWSARCSSRRTTCCPRCVWPPSTSPRAGPRWRRTAIGG